jgi:hypothetical protein
MEFKEARCLKLFMGEWKVRTSDSFKGRVNEF